VVKILTGLVTLVGLPSAIATIAVGWPEFQGYIVSLWEAIFG